MLAFLLHIGLSDCLDYQTHWVFGCLESLAVASPVWKVVTSLILEVRSLAQVVFCRVFA